MGAYSPKVYTGRLGPAEQPLTLYIHKISLLAFFGPFTDGNGIFPFPFIWANDIPTFLYSGRIKKVPPFGRNFLQEAVTVSPPSPPPLPFGETNDNYTRDKPISAAHTFSGWSQICLPRETKSEPDNWLRIKFTVFGL